MVEKIEYMRQFHFFRGIPEEVSYSMLYDLKCIKLHRNNPVYKIGDEVQNIYFIKSGVIEIQK